MKDPKIIFGRTQEFAASSRPLVFSAAVYSECPSTHAFHDRAIPTSFLDLRDKSSVPRAPLLRLKRLLLGFVRGVELRPRATRRLVNTRGSYLC
jgi:hypothetical protein